MTFEVETASLNSTVRSMEAELNKITTLASKLYTALEALDGMWVGAAHDSFAAQYAQDQQILDNMRKTIDGVIEGMDKARKKYDTCEQSVSNAIKKISI